jgi:iron(III) transport system ATP-binding protein
MGEIAIRGLTKSYGGGAGAAAIGDLSLDIAGNQFVTLLGPSGCGKTTTLRLIAGFLAPDAGTIHAGGRLVSSPGHVVPPEERGMGMVFQNYAVWPHKTVYENVVFGLKLRRVPAAEARGRVKSALALVNLTGLEERLPGELSGGQQQRVALARSLVVAPEILLLDEPLSNLDAKLRERMRGELKELQRRTGITFVYVTHDQAEALALSDRIAVIHGGRLQQFGTPREVYSRPASRVVADFMGLVNLLPATVAGRGEVRLSNGWNLEVDVPAAIASGQRVEAAIRPENIRLRVPAGAAQPHLPARIVDSTFLGSTVEYHVALENDTVLRVQAHPTETFAVGDTVAVDIDAGQCTVFEASAGADNKD